ncbi:hypothetical protein DYB32_008690 [Aphanomyces invadans]|uniref:cGMP-dependent protein kinase n=1 Tax=Aphanomyces invadans TaxID=157072 RepID=A0A418AKC5_9STRA|nr:hypothetical protein DYB32_008690 [Aphanomyces invadans]
MTAEQALAHPWLSPTNATISTLKRPATALKRFQRGRKRLRASILAVLLQGGDSVEDRDPSKLKELARGLSSKPEAAAPKAAIVASALGVFDRDNKGYISRSDLKRVTSELGNELSDHEIRDMIGSAGGDPEAVHLKQKLQYQDIQRAISSLRSALYAAGDTISEEGAVDPHFYVLMEGNVDVVCRNAVTPMSSVDDSTDDHRQIWLRTLAAGDYFGVMELLAPDGTIHPRVSSYRCMSRTCKVLKLLVDDFSTVSAIYKSMDDRFQDHALHQAHTQIIKCIEDAHGHVQRQSYDADEVVYMQGDDCDSYFIVTSGAVVVEKDGVVVERLGAGDCFPLGVVVRATEPTTVVEIQGATFRSFLCSYRFMMAYFEDQAQQRKAQRHVAWKQSGPTVGGAQ